ncbi:MAG: hypothetical protein RIQ33_845 [Bacteroidota bacterium]|jgi:hypothetical protein
MQILKIQNYPDLLNDVINYNYASVPLLIENHSDQAILILTKRNKAGKSLPFLYEFSKKSLKVIKRLNDKPFLELGNLGSYDEDGIMPVCSIQVEGKIYLYYIGWNLGKSVPFRNSIGLAISDDNGHSFYKPFNGPVLDRSIHDPCFVASCFVLKDDGFYKMWYLSCDEWIMDINGKPNHKYNIKYATSTDAINWTRNGIIAIDYEWENEYAISVPRVIKENGIYKMWYSYRGSKNITTYRIGYAESVDGIIWERKDKKVDFSLSTDGFDSEMVCYPFIFDANQKRYMLYNGNGYGKTGFGIAELI